MNIYGKCRWTHKCIIFFKQVVLCYFLIQLKTISSLFLRIFATPWRVHKLSYHLSMKMNLFFKHIDVFTVYGLNENPRDLLSHGNTSPSKSYKNGRIVSLNSVL